MLGLVLYSFKFQNSKHTNLSATEISEIRLFLSRDGGQDEHHAFQYIIL